jgi:c-di-GMP-binding flagellar brake protein YcgR
MATSNVNFGNGVRRTPRFRVNVPIRLFASVKQRKCVLQGCTHDLSEDGVAIYIPMELQAGSDVRIEFVAPETQQHIDIQGVVRASSGFRCGIEFRDLTPDDQAVLQRQCDALATVSQKRMDQRLTLRLNH